MRRRLAVALVAGLAAPVAVQPGPAAAVGPHAVYGIPPGIAAGQCDRASVDAPRVAGAFGDAADRACLGLALEYAHDRKWVTWTTTRGGMAVSPMHTYETNDGFCRDFMAVVAPGAAPTLRTACRDAQAVWKLQDATDARTARPKD